MFHCVPIALQELEQCAGSFRKLETKQALVRDAASVPAHHITHVELCHFVIAHVDHRITGRLEVPYDALPLFATIRQRETNEQLGGTYVVIAIIEFGDATLTERFAKLEEAPCTSGISTAISASRCPPMSARSAT